MINLQMPALLSKGEKDKIVPAGMQFTYRGNLDLGTPNCLIRYISHEGEDLDANSSPALLNRAGVGDYKIVQATSRVG